MDRRIFRGSEERNEGENERKNLRRYFVMQTTKERGPEAEGTVEIVLCDRHGHGFHAPSGKKSARLSTVPFKSLIPSFVTNVTLTLMLHASCNLGRVAVST